MRDGEGGITGSIFEWARHWPEEPDYKGLGAIVSEYYGAYTWANNKALRTVYPERFGDKRKED